MNDFWDTEESLRERSEETGGSAGCGLLSEAQKTATIIGLDIQANPKRGPEALFALVQSGTNHYDILQVIKSVLKDIGTGFLNIAAATLSALSISPEYIAKELGEIGISKQELQKALAGTCN